MAYAGADLTHRAYEFALGQGLGTWECSAHVLSHHEEGNGRQRAGLFSARRNRPGRLLLHVFEDGIVVERLKGRLRGCSCEAITADFVELNRASGPGRVALRLLFESGQAVILLEATSNGGDALHLVASRCRSTTSDLVPYREAVAALAGDAWI
ncbi:hypothetical protein BJ980_000235 [Nocardioides daedukensis]|uniref:Uncharacterized protein n=1 Tax=Nocardioides daedukensis TaxID=634462 RepID=A0A7Y9UNM4_9ACTN|nr:hypothetical protein [Nocardioides daedukensis]NYG57312.1 hypothetical protein [Nocardioides daedukensis]